LIYSNPKFFRRRKDESQDDCVRHRHRRVVGGVRARADPCADRSAADQGTSGRADQSAGRDNRARAADRGSQADGGAQAR